MIHRLSRAALSALALLAVACSGGDGPTKQQVATTIEPTTTPSVTVPVGQAAGTFAVRVRDAAGSPMANVGVTFTVTGNATVSPATTTTDAEGIARTTVTAGSAAGGVTIRATVTGTGLQSEASFVVTGGSSATCVSPAVGTATTVQGVSSACVTGGSAGADYVLVAYNSSTTGASSTTLSGTGLGTPPSSAALAPEAALAWRGEGTLSVTPRPDLAFHERLQERQRTLEPRFAGARRWHGARSTGRSSGLTAQGATSSRSIIPESPQVGQVIQVNVNANQNCSSPIYRPSRIVAVGTRSVVLADTTNPSGGFTEADYQRFAARFDTLVYPLDVANFGAPSDIDKNGRVGIVFTKGVNELTAKNSSSFVGGFFYSRDLFPKDSTREFGAGCAGSNEGELFYMLAPDPLGVAYQGSDGTPSASNIRRTGFVDSLTTSTIAHEFQHLINASRRIYVNTGATNYEVVWLNEGLSHIAEELLYYKESGKSPRQNLTDANIRTESPDTYPFWRQDMAQNFSRFSSYLRDPNSFSAVLENDELAVRGAAWAYLRYAADQLYAADGDVWFRLANSTVRGFATLRLAFGDDQVGLLRDFSVAHYIDDTGFSTTPRYMHKSWNFRDIYTKTFTSGVYPLKVTGLANGAASTFSVVQNSAAYYRFTVPANGEGRLELGGNTAAAAPFQFVIVRTR